VSLQEYAGGFYGFLVGLQECYAIGASLHMGYEGSGNPIAETGGEIIANQGDFLLAARYLSRNFSGFFLTHRRSVPFPRRISGAL